MFNNENERYMTRGIAETIHPEVTHLLRHLIDSKIKKRNQVIFNPLSYQKLNGEQIIFHRQEQPPREGRGIQVAQGSNYSLTVMVRGSKNYTWQL